MSHQSLARRSGVLLASAAVAAAALVPAVPATAAEPDPAPATAGAGWLANQLTDGLVVGEWGPDYGLSVDTALAMHAVSEQGPSVQAVADALETSVDSYLSFAYSFEGEDFYGDVGGATAKTLALAQAVDADTASFGGVDLVDRLESLVSDEPGIEGRLIDTAQGAPDYTYANALGQSYAVQALDAAGSPEADAATDFLLAQQCDDGYFRLLLSAPDSADQSCDGDAESVPDTDVTALAVLSLLPQSDDADVAPHLTAALAWLSRTQAADGSFGGGASTEAPNANSTGLAGWALGAGCWTAQARRAASWVAGLQVTSEDATGPLADEQGAVAYDPAALVAARESGIGDGMRDQWRRASAQAVPSLAWLPGGRSPVRVSGPKGYHKAGSKKTLTITGAEQGEQVCLTGPAGLRRSLTGTGSEMRVRVSLPKRTGKATYTTSTPAGDRRTAVKVLGKKKLPFSIKKKRVRKGATQVVKVRGLAGKERVRVHVRGKRVAVGTATAQGRFTARFRVRGKVARLGKAKVVVRGQFGNRRNTKAFLVLR